MKSSEKMIPKDSVVQEVSQQVKQDLTHSVDELTPWFFRALPPFYYQVTPKEEQISHLHTVLSLYQITAPSATLTSDDQNKVTFISVTDRPGQLERFLSQLVDRNIRSAVCHSALEGNLIIGQFSMKSQKIDHKDPEVQKKISQIRSMLAQLSISENKKGRIEKFLQGMNQEYLTGYDAKRIISHIQFYLQIKDYETLYSLDNERDPQFSRISLCTIKPPKTGYLLQIVKILHRQGLQINRIYLNTIDTSDEEDISILTIYAVDDEGHKIDPESPLWKHLTINAKRVKWVVEDELSDLMIMGERFFSIEKVNFLRATAVYLHQFLSKIQLERYTYEVIKKTFLRYPSISNLLIDYFYAKFSPQIEDVCSHCGTKLEKRKKEEAAMKLELTAAIENVEYEVHKDIFYGALHFIDHILKTNYFLEDSIGLAFRMDPKVLDPDIYKPLPYGFFFFYGRGYKGFHVRFEDMSRGGLRIVRTRDMEHYDFESVRVFDEVFALSWAQHLKNKDIPEGGSKGIILLHPNAEVQQSVECVIDSMLDLLVPYGDHPLHPNIVDHYGKPEYIYLGPDENMRDDLIEWIIDRAKERHYKYPNAFMSSKPGVGINHKKYGVTSQGVNVYVENTLRYLKIDPYEEEFTVRMVGGPDGDVAGNELKILIKTYPKVKILAISDGEGAAYDPLGLDKGEILRLAEASLSIAHFDKKKLKSPGAYVVTADTPEGRKMRDEQQLSNEIHAHLYIPAGGRPNTINIDNWKSLLDSAGRPVVKAIIEGANLFLTNEARLRLESRGVIVIRDSSANKGGVICSSYEVLACLMLTEEEFLAIKDEYVYEVIEILKEKAQLESELLFREYNLRNGKIPLTHLSKQISKEINDLTLTIKECIGKEFEKGQRFDLYERILKSHFPPILRQEKYWHRAATMIPEAHRLAILATTIASYIIYREGLGWIQSLNYPDIVRIIQVYLEQDRLVSDYIRTILESNLPGKETIAQILDHNARKELTREILMAD